METAKKNYKGLIILLALVLIIIIGVVYANADKGSDQEERIACTMDAMMCPDGSYVGRSGPKCEFVCPENTEENKKPVINSITPTSGKVGTIVEISGDNLAGFEGDLDAWITNDKGEKAFLAGIGSVPREDGIIKVEIDSKLCTVVTTYSGLECPSYMTIIPGVYSIYTAPWGKESNKVEFTVTK